jgi:hypothetical protein
MEYGRNSLIIIFMLLCKTDTFVLIVIAALGQFELFIKSNGVKSQVFILLVDGEGAPVYDIHKRCIGLPATFVFD